MTPASIIRSAEILESYATELRESYTRPVDFVWRDEDEDEIEAHKEYNELARTRRRAARTREGRRLMPCQIGNGIILCSGRGRDRTPRCSCCGNRAPLLCDYPTGTGEPVSSGTCDKPLCRHCARSVGPDRHYCPGHPAGEQMALLR